MSIAPATVPAASNGAVGQNPTVADRSICFKCGIAAACYVITGSSQWISGSPQAQSGNQISSSRP
jgi:hypothetical protein